MKKVLITGKNSYIGMSFENWVMRDPNNYIVDTVDMKNDLWKKIDFGQYDVVFHVAGIAHVKETKKNKELYFRVNRDLAYGVAKKSKVEGVKQFIFLSSMSVYGLSRGDINKNTLPNPKTAYGKSKLEAEELIAQLGDSGFAIAILRPPMVYGKGCKGNYPKLARLVLKTVFFPIVDNKRSMIFIDNLSEFVRLVIDNKLVGLFFPQNNEYVNTTHLVQLISKANGKKVILSVVFSPFISLGIKASKTLSKVFGSFVYDKNMPGGPNSFEYETCSFEKSIEKTEE